MTICKTQGCEKTIARHAMNYCSIEHYNKSKVYDYKLNDISEEAGCFNIHLYGGYICKISKEDIDTVKGRLWHYTKSNGVVSNKRKDDIADKKHGHFKIHRYILNPSDDMVVDHINGDKLDNRRENLRVVTQSENMVNRLSRPMRNIEKRGNYYNVRMRYKGIRYNIGGYNNLEDAIRERDIAAERIHGEYRSR